MYNHCGRDAVRDVFVEGAARSVHGLEGDIDGKTLPTNRDGRTGWMFGGVRVAVKCILQPIHIYIYIFTL